MSTDETLRKAEQQMLAARPWEAAEDGSIWSISGDYPKGRGTFADCLAVVIPRFATGSDKPLFRFICLLDEYVDPALITRATPLLLVHRDEPGTPYWEHDREWLREVAS